MQELRKHIRPVKMIHLYQNRIVTGERNEAKNQTFQYLKAIAILMVIDDHMSTRIGILSSLFPYNSFYMPLFVFIFGYYRQILNGSQKYNDFPVNDFLGGAWVRYSPNTRLIGFFCGIIGSLLVAYLIKEIIGGLSVLGKKSPK